MLAGKLSDILINSAKGKGGNVGKRIQVRAASSSVCAWLDLFSPGLAQTFCVPIFFLLREGSVHCARLRLNFRAQHDQSSSSPSALCMCNIVHACAALQAARRQGGQ